MHFPMLQIVSDMRVFYILILGEDCRVRTKITQETKHEIGAPDLVIGNMRRPGSIEFLEFVL